jgi:Mce-associated membrane protein
MTDSSPAAGRHRREAQPRPRSRSRAATLVMALLCIPAGVAAIVFLAVTPSSNADAASSLQSSTSQAGLQAAKAAIPTILSYDYRSIAADIAKAKADTTGVFAKQYGQSAGKLLKQAKQLHAIVQATVGSAGVVSADPHNVVALLFVDQATVRRAPGQSTPQTRIDQDRVVATMTNVNGKWLVSALAAE